MVELVVVSGVMIMLFLGIWYLGKFQDIQATTIQAARYAAWERVVHKPTAMSDATLQAQTRGRLFSWNTDPFKSTDGQNMSNGGKWATQNGMWLDHTGGGKLLGKPGDVTVSTTSSALPGGTFMNGALKAIKAVSAAGGLTGGTPLNTGGLYQSQVSVRLTDVSSLPAPLNDMKLTLNEKHAVATDSWDASGPKEVAMVTRNYSPAAIFEKINPLLRPLEVGLSLIEPSFKDLHLGQICPDVVPADRVGSGENLKVYSGSSPCY
ncbi:hypothetical protein CAter282_2885 [Collimonas arenae]|uniref:Uncharacterized protein n=2 Tax=Collimonas arenae TaxID=279058 RepID=A0A127PSM6_9BURK|nr:hypothetical protein CAter10_3178 [Collimonas arenae]AMP10609.1 hypothetical protein CAter282_2885 [Collimonas arenae]